MSQYFISAIGTDVGKSFCAAAMLNQAPHYRAVKPVISGYDGVAGSDSGLLLEAMGEPVSEEGAARISPFRFKAPLSPHIAAEQEGRVIDPDELCAFCDAQMQAHSHLLIEGVGGVMVPLTRKYWVLNWMKQLNLPVILVAGSYLGAINHTMLSVNALRQEGVMLQGVIISQSEVCVGLEQVREAIWMHIPVGVPIITIPRLASWKDAPNLLQLLA